MRNKFIRIILKVVLIFQFQFFFNLGFCNVFLSPQSKIDEVVVFEKIKRRVELNYRDSKKELLLRHLKFHYTRWWQEVFGVLEGRVVDVNLIEDIYLTIFILSSSFFYTNNPTYQLDQMISRHFMAIYGGSYDYREVKTLRDEKKVKIRHNGLYPWIAVKSDQPALFLKCFMKLVIFMRDNSSFNIISIYNLLEKMEFKFDVLLDIIDQIKILPEKEMEQVFAEIWIDISSGKFALYEADLLKYGNKKGMIDINQCA